MKHDKAVAYCHYIASQRLGIPWARQGYQLTGAKMSIKFI